jgi:hypothetical protein
VNYWTRKLYVGVTLLMGLLSSAHAVYVDGNPLSYVDPRGLAIECRTVLHLGIVAIQKCSENGKTPTEQEARDAKRMSDKTLKDACKNNGYEDAHALKKDLGLDSKSDIFSDKNGNMYSGPRKGTGLPEYLHMNTSGIAPVPTPPVP